MPALYLVNYYDNDDDDDDDRQIMIRIQFNLPFCVQAPTKLTMFGCRPACFNILISLNRSSLSDILVVSIWRKY